MGDDQDLMPKQMRGLCDRIEELGTANAALKADRDRLQAIVDAGAKDARECAKEVRDRCLVVDRNGDEIIDVDKGAKIITAFVAAQLAAKNKEVGELREMVKDMVKFVASIDAIAKGELKLTTEQSLEVTTYFDKRFIEINALLGKGE